MTKELFLKILEEEFKQLFPYRPLNASEEVTILLAIRRYIHAKYCDATPHTKERQILQELLNELGEKK